MKKLLPILALFAFPCLSQELRQISTEPIDQSHLRLSLNAGAGFTDIYYEVLDFRGSLTYFESPRSRFGLAVETSHALHGKYFPLFVNTQDKGGVTSNHFGLAGVVSCFPKSRIFNMYYSLGLGGVYTQFTDHIGWWNGAGNDSFAHFVGTGILVNSQLEFDFRLNPSFGIGFSANLAVPIYLQQRFSYSDPSMQHWYYGNASGRVLPASLALGLRYYL